MAILKVKVHQVKVKPGKLKMKFPTRCTLTAWIICAMCPRICMTLSVLLSNCLSTALRIYIYILNVFNFTKGTLTSKNI